MDETTIQLFLFSSVHNLITSYKLLKNSEIKELEKLKIGRILILFNFLMFIYVVN